MKRREFRRGIEGIRLKQAELFGIARPEDFEELRAQHELERLVEDRSQVKRTEELRRQAQALRDAPANPPDASSHGLTARQIIEACGEAGTRWKGPREPTKDHVVDVLIERGWNYTSPKTLDRAMADLGMKGWPPLGT